MALLVSQGMAWQQSGGAVPRPAWWFRRDDPSMVAAQLRADVDDVARQRARPGVKNWFTFCERAAPGGGVEYDNYSSGVVEWALTATPGVWARVIGREVNGGEAGVDVGLQRMLTAAKRRGAAGLVLHEPGHFIAIRSADLALLAELAEQEGREPAQGDRHRFHIIDSMQRGATAGLTATQVVELVRDRLRNNHDVIVVGRDGEADVATGSAPKRARPNGGGGGEGGGVRPANAAGGGGDVGASGAAAASSGAAGETTVGAAGGGGADVDAAVPLSVEHGRSVSAAPPISHLNRVRDRTRYVGPAQATPPAPLGAVGPRTEAGESAMPSLYGRATEYATQVVGRALAALPVSLAAVWQQADEGGSAMDVATEGDEAAQQGGASAEGDGAVQMGTEGVGLEDSTDGTVGLGWGAVEAGAATEESTDMDVDTARVGKAKRKQKGKSKARMRAKKQEATKQAAGTGP